MKRFLFFLSILICGSLSAQKVDFSVSGVTRTETSGDEFAFKFNTQDHPADHSLNTKGLDTLYITVDQPVSQITVTSHNYQYYKSNVSWVTQKMGFLVLESGHSINVRAKWVSGMDFLMVYSETYFEEGPDTIEINSSDAIFSIEFDPVDKSGNHFDQLPGNATNDMYFAVPRGEGYFIDYISINEDQNILLSTIPDGVQILCSSLYNNTTYQNDSYYVEYPAIHEIYQNILLENIPGEYRVSRFSMFVSDLPFPTLEAAVCHGFVCTNMYGGENFMSQGSAFYLEPRTRWRGELYIINQTYDNGLRPTVHLYYGTPWGYQESRSIRSPGIELVNDSICAFNTVNPPYNVYKVAPGDTLKFGESTLTQIAKWWGNNNPDEVIFAPYIFNEGSLGERAFSPAGYFPAIQLFDKDGNMINIAAGEHYYYPNAEQEKYSIRIYNDEYASAAYGEVLSEVVSEFDLGAEDGSPPAISPIQFRDEMNQLALKAAKGNPLFMFFNATDFNDIYHSPINLWLVQLEYQSVIDDSTRVFVREHGDSVWTETAVVNIHEDSISGINYKTDFSAFTNTDSSALDVKIKTQDNTGNSSTYIIAPAILVEDMSTGVEDLFPRESNFQFTLYPNPASSVITIKTSLATNNNTFVTFHNISGQLIIHQQITDEQTKVDMSGLPKGIYFVKVSNDQMMHVEKIIKQ